MVALRSLSGRLLVLTILFVMLAEFLIYAPSISRFRKTYLEEHIAKAQLATLALEATPDNMVSRDLEDMLLFHAEAYAVIVDRPDRRMLALSKDMPPAVDATFDLRHTHFPTWISDAFAALLRKDNRVLRVIGESTKNPGVAIEVVLDEAPMREAMLGYSTRILQLSVVISLFTAGLVYLTLQWLMVRPLRRITRNMTRFRANPEDETRIIVPSDRGDEIGVAQRELAEMQREVRAALRQKGRLAALGSAVAKINHDLRNTLATAVLVSDRLAYIDDPEVKKVTPRLMDAVNRAVGMCSQTLDYLGDTRTKLSRSLFHLQEVVAEVGAAQRETFPDAAWDNAVPFEVDLEADRELLVRALGNLARNAFEAGAARVRVEARRDGRQVEVDVVDDGPGLSQRALDNLFKPFAGSVRKGGTGLGLVIVRDILRAHGGDVTLVRSADDGTVFRLVLPARRR
ncbi:MAG: HAMP domain-containing histidine kinase [Hyphomicrobiales bacterium]|nr:HAMP domain-containing histidine kinase [Hyphomicrobiales bacterium]